MAKISVFYKRVRELCEERNMTINELVRNLNLSSGSPTAWKNGTEPRFSTVRKIADYFHVSADYLLGNVSDPFFELNAERILMEINGTYGEKQKAPTLTKKDERDIARDVERIMAQLGSSGDLMFDGDPMTAEARESMLAAMQLGLQAAKLKNKERFTTKKNKKG